MLGSKFSFEEYMKNVREKATKEVLLDADGHTLA